MIYSRRWSMVLIVIMCGAVRGYPGETATSRSSCYEIRAEAIVTSEYLGPPISLRWSTEVVTQDPIRAPIITLSVHGEPVDRSSLGFQTLDDTRLYHAGAVKFESMALTDAALAGLVVIEASNDERPECLTSVEIGPFRAPELMSIDLRMLTEARERIKRVTENNGDKQAPGTKSPLRETLEEVLLETLHEHHDSYESALLSQDDVANSEILREFLIPSWCSWGSHMWGTGPIGDWKLNSPNTALAAEGLERTSSSLIELSDKSLKCCRFAKLAAKSARFGSPETTARAAVLARDACEGFPVAMRMVEVSELVASGRMEKNSHGWLELTETKAKFGGEDHR